MTDEERVKFRAMSVPDRVRFLWNSYPQSSHGVRLDLEQEILAQVPALLAENAALTAERDKLLAENEQYRQVVQEGKRLPAPELSQDAAFAAFTLGKLEDERDKLQRFKNYVHKRLDDAGVSADPESVHKAEGCRIGGRLDEVFAERDGLRAALHEVLESLANYRRCHDSSLSPYIRENGRHGGRRGSPWFELLNDAAMAALLLQVAKAKPADAPHNPLRKHGDDYTTAGNSEGI